MAVQTREAPRTRVLARMGYEEFLSWQGEGQHVEWVNGEVVEMPPIAGDHDTVSHFLHRVLGEFLEEHPVGVLRHDPFQMKTAPNLPGRAPDFLIVRNENLDRLHDTYLEGPADLVIEIVSPGSRVTDAIDKLAEYERGGVPEYWLIDPSRKSARFFRLDTRRRYVEAQPDSGDRYESVSLTGLWIHVAWLWELPPVRAVRRAWSSE